MNTPTLVALAGNEALAERLATALGAPVARLEARRFPDQETYLRYASDLAGLSVALICTLDRPDEKFLPLVFAAAAARDLGAMRVGLVSPYLAYMRQDRRFQPGEAVTSQTFAKLLSPLFDWLVTVDPHLHRRAALNEIYQLETHTVHAAPLLSDWVRRNVERPLLIGPDSESEQWVASVARAAGAPHIVLEKVRRGDRDVAVVLPELAAWHDFTPVLIDDIVSTGRTMIETVSRLRRQGLPAPVCLAVHGVFSGGAEDEIMSSGAARLVTTNTVAHPTNRIDVTGLLAEAIRAVAS